MNMKESELDYKNEYERLKKDFTDYAYIVSHDLNAPVRHIREFSKLLFEELENHLNSECFEYKHYIEKSVDVIEKKLDALLKISRVNTAKWHYVKLDIREVIECAVRQVENNYNFNCRISGVFPELNVDPDSFQTALFNVIENAAKFYKGEDKPSVEINSVIDEEKCILKIIDNGVGIKESKLEDVFEIFKKIDARFKGIGAGLSVTRKILERYDGKISVKSVLGEGTEVTITLPLEIVEK